MTLAKRINAAVRELSALEGGKVNMDAPMFRAFLKAQAKLMAKQAYECESHALCKLVEDLANIALDNLHDKVRKSVQRKPKARKPKKAKR